MVSFGGAAAGVYDYHRQISKSFTAGPYLIMYAAGYADSRPQVPVTDDPYSDAEMTNMAAGRRPFRRAHARRRPGPAPLPRDTRMLTRGWRPGIALLAVAGLVVAGRAARRPGPGRGRRPRRRHTGQTAVGAEHAQRRAAWSVTRGAGVTVAVIDSGVNPNVSDLSGSVITGPDYTGVTTSPSSTNWGVHGTWMASLIAGHGHDGGLSGVIGIAPAARILSIRVIPDRADPHYHKYEREQETVIQESLADGDQVRRRRTARTSSACRSATARPAPAVRSALQYAYEHGVAVVSPPPATRVNAEPPAATGTRRSSPSPPTTRA